ncbi:MAG: DNA repair protein [Oscillospiraceae bacterium]|nr:DNA repair protein [Oscillospiraceae bacterium]
METRQYLCIDLKSFYASVECVERGLDPMTTNLVVADPERSDKTICLAVTPAMKALGVHNRCRIFEIPSNIEYLVAPPRMKRYVEYAAEIYAVYLQFVSAEDIHVYSIDEAFLDVTHYMALYGMTAKELAQEIMKAIFDKTGIRATCGVGTNLYLAKIALDITAKHAEDFIGVLNEESYRKTMWDHKPLTDFWRIGKGTAKKLETYGIHTMGQIARTEEDLLYRWFGIDAELLIDHAWGREPVTIADIKGYKAKSNCLTSGQVLMRDYDFDEGRLIVKEMMDLLCLEMTQKNLLTDSVTLHVGYSNQLKREPTHGSASIAVKTNVAGLLIPAVAALYDRIVDPSAPIRRVNLTCNRVEADTGFEQLSLFARPETGKREQKLQQAVLGIKERFGKNAILKGMNLEESATTRERNRQIGGHKSGE